MLDKRKSVDRDDGDCLHGVTPTFRKLLTSSSEEELFSSYVEDETYTNWKFLSYRSSIRKFLGGDPATIPVVNQLGLAQALSIDYTCRPMIHAVREFALGFNSTFDCCNFRGRQLAFNTDVVRAAFLLPSGKSRLLGDDVLNREELSEIFGKDPSDGITYTVYKLKGDYKSWAQPVVTVQGLLLGMPSSFRLSANRTRFFSAYLSNKVQPSDRPDWAELVHHHLKNELERLKNHLKTPRWDIKMVSRFRCSCGTAVIRILMHLGFTEEELSHATKRQRSEVGVPKVGSAGRVTLAKSTGMRTLRVVEGGQGSSTGGGISASAASADRCKDTKSSSSSGWANSESSEDGVLQDYSKDSGNPDPSEEDIAPSSGNSREPDLVKVQEKSSEIQSRRTKAHFDKKQKEFQAIFTSMDAQNQELLQQKQKADAQFLKLKIESYNKLATLQSEKDKIELERDTTLLELKSLREEKKLLDKAHQTLQQHLDEEGKKDLCRICMESRKDTMFIPCLHFHYCFSCYDAHSKQPRTCPTCRMLVQAEVRAGTQNLQVTFQQTAPLPIMNPKEKDVFRIKQSTQEQQLTRQ